MKKKQTAWEWLEEQLKKDPEFSQRVSTLLEEMKTESKGAAGDVKNAWTEFERWLQTKKEAVTDPELHSELRKLVFTAGKSGFGVLWATVGGATNILKQSVRVVKQAHAANKKAKRKHR